MIFPDTNSINIGVEDVWPEMLGHPRHLAITWREPQSSMISFLVRPIIRYTTRYSGAAMPC